MELTLDQLIEELTSLRDLYDCGDYVCQYTTEYGLEKFTCDNFEIDRILKSFIVKAEYVH